MNHKLDWIKILPQEVEIFGVSGSPNWKFFGVSGSLKSIGTLYCVECSKREIHKQILSSSFLLV